MKKKRKKEGLLSEIAEELGQIAYLICTFYLMFYAYLKLLQGYPWTSTVIDSGWKQSATSIPPEIP